MKDDVYHSMYSDEETHWWYVARRRLILAELDALLATARAGGAAGAPRILDYGCGTGRNLVEFAKRGTACGLDASPDALEYCRKRGLSCLARVEPDRLAAGENPFGDPFDVIVLTDVLEHLDDDCTALKHLLPLLRPGGRVLITVPAYKFLWSGEDYVSHHRRRYRAGALAAVVRHAGYEIERITYFNTLLFPLQAGVILFNRLFRPKSMLESNVRRTRPALNNLLTRVFSAEAGLLRRVRFPFGGSILCCARRPATGPA